MSQLGYTWYPKDWFISNTRKRLKRFPLVRYALRELFDLMYIESGPIEMNREYLIDDLDIELTDMEYEKLLEYIDIQPNGKWWINTVKKRITKAEAARENGKKGGRPPKEKNTQNNTNNKTQKPTEKTQQQNPKNPPSESKRERERETKVKEKLNINKIEREKGFRAIDILKNEKQSELDVLWMQNKNQIDDKVKLIDSFNAKMELEVAQGKITFDANELMPRFKGYVIQWGANSQDAKAKIKNQEQPIQSVSKRNYF